MTYTVLVQHNPLPPVPPQKKKLKRKETANDLKLCSEVIGSDIHQIVHKFWRKKNSEPIMFKSAAEWLRSLTSNHLLLTAVGSNPYRDFFSGILSCEEAIQLAYGTSVFLLRCPFVPEIMHGRSSSTSKAWTSPSKWPTVCRCDVKHNQTNKQIMFKNSFKSL
jgi:hypothetical protein